jgi:predicted RNA polymerase sigma factor
LLLENQDRSGWNRAQIAEGLRHLEKSARGERLTAYHLEAGIAACHAIATTYQETDWSHILELYEQLAAVNPSPVVALNRAVAVVQCHGPAAGLRALETVRDHPSLQDDYLLWAILAKIHALLGDRAKATAHYGEALRCTCSAPERRFLESSLASLTSSG